MMKRENRLKRYLTLYLVFLKHSLQAQMEYRVNFVFSVLAECGWICSHLLYLVVLYRADIAIGDFDKDSLFLFVGSYLVITGIFMSMFFPNFSSIPEYIRTGQMDIFITKPMSLQFMATMRNVDFGFPIADFAVGICLIVTGFVRLDISVNPVTVLGFIGFLCLGGLWCYSIQLIPVLLSFWTVKVSGVYGISYAVHDMNKMPRAVYGKLLQRIGTFLFPLFPMANDGILFVMGKLSGIEFLWGLTGPFLFFFLTKGIWDIAAKRYVSAGS